MEEEGEGQKMAMAVTEMGRGKLISNAKGRNRQIEAVEKD